MASTPQTSGFRASVMPTFQGADPRLFNSYGALATGLQSGVDMAAKLQEVRLKREQQARLAEQAAYEQTQRAGLEETRRLQNLTTERALDQPIWGLGTRYEPTYGDNVLVPQTDDAGNPLQDMPDIMDGSPLMEYQAAPQTGRVAIEIGKDRYGKQVERRIEANPLEAEKFALELARKERDQLNTDREFQLKFDAYELARQKGLIEDIPGTNTYWDWTSGEAVMKQYGPGFVRRENPLQALVDIARASKNPSAGGNPPPATGATGTAITVPAVVPAGAGLPNPNDFKLNFSPRTPLVEPVIVAGAAAGAPVAANTADNADAAKVAASNQKLISMAAAYRGGFLSSEELRKQINLSGYTNDQVNAAFEFVKKRK